MGEFKNGQISISSIILSNVPGRIQDGVEVFESGEWTWAKLTLCTVLRLFDKFD